MDYKTDNCTIFRQHFISRFKRKWRHIIFINTFTKRYDLSIDSFYKYCRIPIEEAFKKLREYTTFFVNRKPLQRTVSAHSSKFTDRVKLDGYKNNLGKPAALRYLPEYVHNIKIRFINIYWLFHFMQ